MNVWTHDFFCWRFLPYLTWICKIYQGFKNKNLQFISSCLTSMGIMAETLETAKLGNFITGQYSLSTAEGLGNKPHNEIWGLMTFLPNTGCLFCLTNSLP